MIADLLRHLLARFRRSAARAVPVEPLEEPRAPEGNDNAAPAPPIDGTEAVRQLLGARHSDEERFIVADSRDLNHVPVSREVWERHGDGLKSSKLTVRVLTASGAVVRPEQLRARCMAGACGRFEDTVLRCSRCHVALCRLHALSVEVPGEGPVVLCPEHHRLLLANWNAWRAHDAATRPKQKANRHGRKR